MTIEFSKEAHVDVVMFVAPPGANFDALFVIHTPPGAERRRLTFRFRYDGEDGEADTRNWHAYEEGPEAQVPLRDMVKLIAGSAVAFFGAPVEELMEVYELDCDGEQAARTLLDQAPWFNPSPTQAHGGEA